MAESWAVEELWEGGLIPAVLQPRSPATLFLTAKDQIDPINVFDSAVLHSDPGDGVISFAIFNIQKPEWHA